MIYRSFELHLCMQYENSICNDHNMCNRIAYVLKLREYIQIN